MRRRSVHPWLLATATAGLLAVGPMPTPLRGEEHPEPQRLETARITVPAAVQFFVTNGTTITAAAPVRVSFDMAILNLGRALRIRVKADDDPRHDDGTSVDAGALSWTTSSASHGIGLNGTLSKAMYSTVFEGFPNSLTGGVDVSWKLTMAAGHQRAGMLQTTLRWRVETFIP